MLENHITDSYTLKAELEALIRRGSNLSNLEDHYHQQFQKKLSNQYPGVELAQILEDTISGIRFVGNIILLPQKITHTSTIPTPISERMVSVNLKLKSELEELIRSGTSTIQSISQEYSIKYRKGWSDDLPAEVKLRSKLQELFPGILIFGEKIFFPSYLLNTLKPTAPLEPNSVSTLQLQFPPEQISSGGISPPLHASHHNLDIFILLL
jgi:hypothetical protein